MADLDVLLSPGTDVGGRSWATVTQASPLRIRIDGEASALDLTPDSLVGGLVVGERVWVELVPQPDPVSRSRRVVVLGRAGGPQWHAYTPSTTSITLGSGGTVTGAYLHLGDLVAVHVVATLGTGGTVSGTPTFSTPADAPMHSQHQGVLLPGVIQLNDTGTNTFIGVAYGDPGNDAFALRVENAAGTYTGTSLISSTVPHSWTDGDFLAAFVFYRPA